MRFLKETRNSLLEEVLVRPSKIFQEFMVVKA